MNFIKWNSKLSVKVKEIDNQHKILIDIINKAFEAQKDKEKINQILNELIEFVRIHFSTEEKYFEKFNYPEKEEHIKEHLNMVSEVLAFKTRFDNSEEIMEEFLDFLKIWLEDHLITTDQIY